MTKTGTLLSEFDWSKTKETWTAWWQGELDRCLVVIDLTEKQRISFFSHFQGWDIDQDNYPVEPILTYFDEWLQKTPLYGDTFPRIWLNFGAGILAAVLGSSVCVAANTIWIEPASNYDWKTLEHPLNKENFWWKWIASLTEKATKTWQGKVAVGFPDLGGNLDILASLQGAENLLLDLSLDPGQVANRAKKITGKWLEAYQDLERYIPAEQFGSSCWAPM